MSGDKIWYLEARESPSATAARKQTWKGDGIHRGSNGIYIGISYENLAAIRGRMETEFRDYQFYSTGHHSRRFYLIDETVVAVTFPPHISQVRAPGTRYYALSIHAATREKRNALASKIGISLPEFA